MGMNHSILQYFISDAHTPATDATLIDNGSENACICVFMQISVDNKDVLEIHRKLTFSTAKLFLNAKETNESVKKTSSDS